MLRRPAARRRRPGDDPGCTGSSAVILDLGPWSGISSAWDEINRSPAHPPGSPDDPRWAVRQAALARPAENPSAF